MTEETFSDINVTVSTDEGTLNAASHLFTKNDAFTFTAIDKAGNSTSQTVVINNILSSSGKSSKSSRSTEEVLTIDSSSIPQAGEFDTFKGWWEDVPETHWAYEAIQALSVLRKIDSPTINSFEPDLSITRAEYTAYLVNVLELYSDEVEENFEDVNSADPYASHIASAYANGLVKGYSPTEFGPNAKIKRQDAVTMLMRAMAMMDEQYNKMWLSANFLDQDDIKAYALNSVNGSTELGLINGYEVKYGYEFRPDGFISRAESAQILNKLYKKKQ